MSRGLTDGADGVAEGGQGGGLRGVRGCVVREMVKS